MGHHDVVVIGSGVAGQTVLGRLEGQGLDVALVESGPLGGTCALRGCIPKKLLMASGEAVMGVRRLEGRGVTGLPTVDWPRAMRIKRDHTAQSTSGIERWIAGSDITLYRGQARFVSANTLDVGGAAISADHVVIATGARPIPLGFEGEEHVRTSTDFLDLDVMPARVCFVGGGYISMEFAWLAHTAGAAVTVVHRSGSVLKEFDRTLADRLVEHYRERGIDVVLDAPVELVHASSDGFRVAWPGGSVIADMVVHGAGRMPDLASLELSAGGVEASRGGVVVDEHLRSVSNPAVWAAGDAAAAGAPLTPVAARQGEVVADGILGASSVFDDRVTPSIAFSEPPIGAVGVSAMGAHGDPELNVAEFDTSGWFSQSREGGTVGGASVVTRAATGEIVGAHALGLHAEETINLFTLAIAHRMTLDDLRSITWAYPTAGYEINYLSGRF